MREGDRNMVEGIDIGSAWPHMSVGRGRICGVPMLLFRVIPGIGIRNHVPRGLWPVVWEAV